MCKAITMKQIILSFKSKKDAKLIYNRLIQHKSIDVIDKQNKHKVTSVKVEKIVKSNNEIHFDESVTGNGYIRL